MRRFADLFVRLDQTTSTKEKIAALVDYLESAPQEDAAWALHFLCGRRLKRLVKRADLRRWLAEITGHPDWLIEESYASVGDLAETIALLLPEPETRQLGDTPLHVWVEQRLQPLASQPPDVQRATITAAWASLPTTGRLLLNKLITGACRVGVSRRLVIRALAQVSGLDTAVIAHRLMGPWVPDAGLLPRLLDPDTTAVDQSTPYPFQLASPLKQAPETLGALDAWQAEWKWDGIRAQLIRRGGQCFVWSRGEELLNGRFPEVETAAAGLPEGTVLDGELLTWQGDRPMGFASLQTRIGRLKPGATTLRKAPVIFMAYDLLEWGGQDVRATPLSDRHRQLDQVIVSAGQAALRRAQPLQGPSWAHLSTERDSARARGVEGLMLKRRDGAYRVGRAVGGWWKWKVDPWTVDAVLTYAQPGSGRRSNQLTDYTFGVWRDDALVTLCKAYSGLDKAEIADLDRWIRQHTLERFGPVRQVQPVHVFEIAFEGIQISKRHKSGLAVRFPRIHRWRKELGITDADSLDSVRDLLDAAE